MDFSNHNWAQPNAALANTLVSCNLDALIESFSYLYDFAGFDGAALQNELNTKKLSVRQNMPQTFLYHEYLVRKIEQEDIHPEAIFNGYLSELTPTQRTQIEVVQFGLRYHEYTNQLLKALIADDHLECYGKHLVERNEGITAPTEQAFDFTAREIETCLDYLKQSCPALYDEIQAVVSQIHVMNSPHVNAGSYLTMLGMFNIRYLKEETEHWSRLMEHIIHEAAHNLLYQLWHQAQIITDDDGLFYTPFRKDERPISGVYHAMFVLARTIYGFNLLLDNPKIALDPKDICSHYNEANNHLPFTDKFHQTVAVLEKSGKLTGFGDKIMKDCVALVKGCHHYI
ncbi:aKG-HExxH-type peptide beta-hydroxylase [Photobacterium sp. TY1-4]|uniref:aKG-HExxH-type peptide beta-hydroxylase n=1 Tax=Photobacterium sp. TY1-4 TaxID=2899122 RepID=UPI0021C16165|nr:HEXXH motif-containing putative peptide modification protein [Photobacterium sp. TY1-4]UXI02516.1 HEXXH motif-containing putative peptide modification protein [Photobacterium sp. TY1-4]